MAGLIALLLFIGLFLYLIWYLFFRSVLWVVEPLIEYFENREAERFVVEEDGRSKVKVTIKDFDKPIHLSKSLLQKAQTEPQRLGNTNLWVLKDYIFASKPTEEKIKEIFEEGGSL